ncbi:MAG: DUF2277 domain-containing protein [Rhizobiaceae bacterium]
MCRNIKPLFNFDPPATREEMHDAALQFVRKVSGTTKPSKRNEAAFNDAVNGVYKVVHQLMNAMETDHQPKNREDEIAKAKARSAARFGKPIAA